ncbi:hypothetical protein BJ166DRAFT_614074 [Pestalotiopsis sp. NC0098]|nr:hypothetical protein BJ166DRAFT_614074 [Pestalotiopsis sp. NC0098]
MFGSLALRLVLLLHLPFGRPSSLSQSNLVARVAPVPNVPAPQTSNSKPGTVITTCNKPGVVALAYDDGPGPYTDQLMDILKQNSVQATFFVNGNNNLGPITEGALPLVLNKILEQGHQIGSHTWSHANLSSLDREERWEEMEALQEALANITGFSPRYMRPPYFACQEDCVQDMNDFGFHVVTANLDTKDFQGDYDYARETFSNALSSGSPSTSSFIVLVHDTHVKTVSPFTQYMIDVANRYEYKFVTVGECLGDPEINWYHHAVKTEQISGNATLNATLGNTLNLAAYHGGGGGGYGGGNGGGGWGGSPDCSAATTISARGGSILLVSFFLFLVL